MPNLRAVLETIKDRALKGLEGLRALFNALVDKIPPKWRLPALISLCLCMALVLGILITALVTGQGQKRAGAADMAGAFTPLTIPPEDFFLPDEPDFLPGLLFEREPRRAWTAEEARPFWTDPLDHGPELWRREIRSAVDKLLERVP